MSRGENKSEEECEDSREEKWKIVKQKWKKVKKRINLLGG